MRKTAMSRRTLLEAGACALAAAVTIPQIARARAETGSGLSSKNEETIRNYYKAWETKEWPDKLLAVEQKVCLQTDPSVARGLARAATPEQGQREE